MFLIPPYLEERAFPIGVRFLYRPREADDEAGKPVEASHG